MSEAESLPVQLRRLDPPAMISLRAKPGTPGLAEAILAASGCALPAARSVTRSGEALCGWMSADEYLLVLPAAAGAAALQALQQGLQGQHYLAVDVSDARVCFALEGAGAGDVLRRLTPADLSALGPDELRRSRLSQVAAAFWQTGGGSYRLVAFRSVGDYVEALLSGAVTSARASGAL